MFQNNLVLTPAKNMFNILVTLLGLIPGNLIKCQRKILKIWLNQNLILSRNFYLEKKCHYFWKKCHYFWRKMGKSMGKNVIIFGADMSSSAHIENKGKIS